MTRTLHRAVLGFAVAGLATCWSGVASSVPPPPDPRPALVCAEPTFDFGRVENTNVVTHTYVVTNASSAPVNIVSIRASCGCTVASASRQKLEPGGTTEVTARLNLAGRRGEQTKTITVMTDAPLLPQLQLWMKGYAVVDIGLEPAYVNFGQIAPDATRETTVELLSRDPSVAITGVSGASERFTAELVLNDAGVANRLRIRAIPPFPSGFTRTDLRIATTHPKASELTLPVSALVPEAVYVIPKWVLVRGPAGGPPARRAFLVRAGAIQTFAVLGVDVPDERIKVQTETVGPSNYRITLTDIPIDTALHGKQVVVRTDAKGFESIPLDIRVTIDPGGAASTNAPRDVAPAAP